MRPVPLLLTLAALCLSGAGCQTAQNTLHGLHDDLLLASNAIDRWAERWPTTDAPRHAHRPNAANTATHPTLWRRPPGATPWQQQEARMQATHLGY